MSKPPTQLRLDRLLANMGYGSRKEMQGLAKMGRIVLDGEPIKDADTRVPVTPDLAQRMTVQGRPLDPPPGFALIHTAPE